MTAGQKAMALAFIYPDPAKYRRGGDPSNLEGSKLWSRLSEARAIKRWSETKGHDVLNDACRSIKSSRR